MPAQNTAPVAQPAEKKSPTEDDLRRKPKHHIPHEHNDALGQAVFDPGNCGYACIGSR